VESVDWRFTYEGRRATPGLQNPRATRGGKERINCWPFSRRNNMPPPSDQKEEALLLLPILRDGLRVPQKGNPQKKKPTSTASVEAPKEIPSPFILEEEVEKERSHVTPLKRNRFLEIGRRIVIQYFLRHIGRGGNTPVAWALWRDLTQQRDPKRPKGNQKKKGLKKCGGIPLYKPGA